MQSEPYSAHWMAALRAAHLEHRWVRMPAVAKVAKRVESSDLK